MSFDRERLPDPASYFEARGLNLQGRGKWRTTSCAFHGGTDSLRINLVTGGWVCMACGVHGGDVLAYEMQTTGAEFTEAAKALGAWVHDGKPEPRTRPAPLPPRQALEVLAFEAELAAVAAANVARGVQLSSRDRDRLLTAANRITTILGAYK